MSPFATQLRRDLRALLRAPGDIVNPLAFFLLVIALFPMGVGPDPALLSGLAPGVVWILALLATLLGVEAMYQQDHGDGSLEQLVLEARPLYLAVLGKALAHWLLTGLPLIAVAPLAALMLSLPVAQLGDLLLALMLGTPTLALLAGIGAALTLGANRGGLLIALLILPLYVPVLIFGAAASQSGGFGGSPAFPLLILCALLAASVTLAPFAIAAALRIAVEH
ncbi:MAG: heme exporter protein CcmB [Pseudomonadota bacterium]